MPSKSPDSTDWNVVDPKLQQWFSEGVKDNEMARRLKLKRADVRNRLAKLEPLISPSKPGPSKPEEKTLPDVPTEHRLRRIALVSSDSHGSAVPTEQVEREVHPSDVPNETPAPPSPDGLPAEMTAVHSGAVSEFDLLPEGYAKEIQPMRKYTDAEEWALNESMRLYGFFGTILRDQYGRILDGHHRQLVARQRGLETPYTIRPVKDDAEAIAIARAANGARRHMYTQEQRQELANGMRDQGFSYRAIAEALGVGVATVYRDTFGVLRIRPESDEASPPVPNGTAEMNHTETGVPNETPELNRTESGVPNRTAQPGPHEERDPKKTPAPPPSQEPEPRTKGRDEKSYPSRRSRKATVTTEAQVITWLTKVDKALTTFTNLIKASRAFGGVTLTSHRWQEEKRRALVADLRHQSEVMTQIADHIDALAAKNGAAEPTSH
jgi:ParB-like chromosome segregation protein Spo0J